MIYYDTKEYVNSIFLIFSCVFGFIIIMVGMSCKRHVNEINDTPKVSNMIWTYKIIHVMMCVYQKKGGAPTLHIGSWFFDFFQRDDLHPLKERLYNSGKI